MTLMLICNTHQAMIVIITITEQHLVREPLMMATALLLRVTLVTGFRDQRLASTPIFFTSAPIAAVAAMANALQKVTTKNS